MYKDRYYRRKEKLLSDSNINDKNREIISRFLQFEEYKLKRKEGLTEVDERSFKTLYGYTGRLKYLNEWFKNKPWADLSEEEIKEVIDKLEDGDIKSKFGKRYLDRSLYYQMLQGKLFSLVKKDGIAKEFIGEYAIKGREFSKDVRFIEEDSFRKIVDCAITPEQRCLLWLSWDIGENINSLLELEKDDFKKQINQDTNEPEYLVILSKDKLKRSRTPRTEITNYKETVNYLDIVLANLKESTKKIANKYIKSKRLSELHGENKLFKFQFKSAETFLKRCVEKSGVRCIPGGQHVTWKDLRSSMACDLLKKGWSHDEVNARLGHRPSSRIIDRYINYLALDRSKPKKKVYEGNLIRLESELEEQKELNKLQLIRIENLRKEQIQMKEDFRTQMETTLVELKSILDSANKN